jgi:pimeloyl-ACP methyl ester carboxylesterase/ubiquinone/menaquinone biosynthesis C-methylase UbiE
MTTTKARAAKQNGSRPPRSALLQGPEARKRLLSGLPVTERRLELNGVSTAVLETGGGPPLVLLHGPGEHAARWFTVIPDLRVGNRVIAPDLPGHGESGMFAGEPDVEAMIGWLEDLIECTCAAPPVLVGHLLGGAIAARFAAARGERAGRLVLVDTLGLAAFQPEPAFASALTGFLTGPTEATHDRLWRHCAFDLDAMRDWMGERWDWFKAYNLDRARNPAVQQALHQFMEQFGFPPIPEQELACIAVPTDLIWGRHDRATPLALAEAAAERYGWPLRVIDTAADDPPIEQPRAFLAALHAALDKPAAADDTRAAWDQIAPGYDQAVTPTHVSLSEEGLRCAGLREGERFLDVAAGSGALSIPAARQGARVLATDRSPAMLARLTERARSDGLNIETRVMDGEALELEDDSFDLAGSQFGVMLFGDMPKGISEMARVARPGGRVLVHAFGDPGRIEFLRFLVKAVRTVRPEFDGPPSEPPPLEFQLADPDRMRAVLAGAGLREVHVDTTTETLEFGNGQALWQWLISSNPIVERVLAGLALTDEEQGGVQRSLNDLVAERTGQDGVARLTSPVNIGIGTK